MDHDPNNLLVWLDLETTGLDPLRCSIIQMGIVVTDNDLNEVDAAEWTITPPGPAHWIEWEGGARTMHDATGLYAKVMGRNDCSYASAVAIETTEFLAQYFPAGFRPMLAGNSVHFDWRFLAYSGSGVFANLARRFFHRHYDASAVMEWARRTMGVTPRWSRPKGTERPHTALADLRETLADMRLLREDMRRTVFTSVDVGQPGGEQ